MKRFELIASVTWSYTVEAETKEAAEALLTEQLGKDWADSVVTWMEDVEHPQIEAAGWHDELMCIGEEDENK